MKKEDLIEMEEADCCFFYNKPGEIYSIKPFTIYIGNLPFDFWWVKANNPKQDPEEIWKWKQ